MPLEKATLTNLVTGEVVEVQFNPEEYTVSSGVTYAQSNIPGISGPLLQFVHGELTTLDMELVLDTLEPHRNGSRAVNPARADVRELVRGFLNLMKIESTTHAPPILLFAWGSLTFRCVLVKATQKFQLFLPSGIPVRARLNVTFHEYRSLESEAQEIKRETADYTRRHVVGQGETLASIAAKLYDDPAMWRPLAIANDIADPRRLAAGTALVVPRLPFRDPATTKVYAT